MGKNSYKDNVIRLGDYVVDFKTNELKGKKGIVRLAPRLSSVLKILVEERGNPVSRDKLIDSIWEGKIVNDDALSRCIAELRILLNDDSQSPKYIETIPKVGYRIIAPVSDQDGHIAKFIRLKYVTTILLLIFISIIIQQISNNRPLSEHLSSRINEATRLTSTKQIEAQTQISMHGDSLAYIQRKNQHFVIEIMSLGGQVLHTIEDKYADLYSPAFSTHQNELYAAAISGNKCTIYKYQLPNITRQEVTKCTLPQHRSGIMDWHTDQPLMAYVHSNLPNKNTAIWLLDNETKTKQQITFPRSYQYDTRPRFSPDGRWLSFQRIDGQKTQIIKIPIENFDNLEVVLSEYTEILSHDWLSSNEIILDSDRTGERYLWKINTQSKEMTNLGGKRSLFPSTDSKKEVLVFQEVHHQSKISLLDMLNNTENDVVVSPGINDHPSFSPKENKFVYSSNREGFHKIWLYDLDARREQLLLSLPNTHLRHPIWNSEGTEILITTSGEGRQTCMVFNLVEKSIKEIQSGELFPSLCKFGIENEILALMKDPIQGLYEREQDGEWSLIEPSVVYYAPTGSSNYLVQKQETHDLVNVSKLGERQKLIDGKLVSPSTNWNVINKNLFMTQIPKHQGTWKISLETGIWEKVSEYSTYYDLKDAFSVSSDLRMMLLTKISRKEGDIYITKMKN